MLFIRLDPLSEHASCINSSDHNTITWHLYPMPPFIFTLPSHAPHCNQYLCLCVKVEQLKHEFGFGTAVDSQTLKDNSNYRQWYLANFDVSAMRPFAGLGNHLFPVYQMPRLNLPFTHLSVGCAGERLQMEADRVEPGNLHLGKSWLCYGNSWAKRVSNI